jgi:hypothetical protein
MSNLAPGPFGYNTLPLIIRYLPDLWPLTSDLWPLTSGLSHHGIVLFVY